MIKKKGFTLVEILVVILIIGLLFVFLVPKISSSTDKAKEAGVKTDMHSYEVAFESVAKENAGYAFTNDAELIGKINDYLDPALQIKDTPVVAGGRVYEAKTKKDPWNNLYRFDLGDITVDTSDGTVRLLSAGSDGNYDETSDNLTLGTKYEAGEVESATSGFSKNVGTNEMSMSLASVGDSEGDDTGAHIEDVVTPTMTTQEAEDAGFVFNAELGCITGYTGTATDLVIPSKINGVPVLGTGESAFRRNTNLRTVVLPSTFKNIECTSFDGCTYLESISLPSNLETISDCAFYMCSSLESVTIPSTVHSIGESSFANCSSLANVNIQNGVQSIAAYAFACCPITTLTIPSSVSYLDTGAFDFCGQLTNVVLEEGVQVVGDCCFTGCSGMTDITIPSSVTVIGEGALDYDFSGTVHYKGSTLSDEELKCGSNATVVRE